jgi:CRP-like cAMP-binding protein
LYIIKEGEVDCSDNGEVIRTLSKGDIFGEKSILTETIRTMDVIAKTVCICFSISVETLQAIIGNNFRDVLYLNLIKFAFKTSSNLNKFESSLIEKTYPSFCIKNYEKNQIVIPKGSLMCDKINILIEGNLVKVNMTLYRIITKLLLSVVQFYSRMRYIMMIRMFMIMI